MTGAERVAKRRAALRAQGLKPKTFWLPDDTDEAFRDEARRDCEKAWRQVPEEEQLMAWVEAMQTDMLRDLPD